jgi:antitoxin (DNA-binding transcriptional repressor) of toxin-antitoxin stability system
MTAKTIPGEVPVRLLDVIDDEEVVVTRDGRPFARVTPIDAADHGPMFGRIQIFGDIVAPLDEGWKADR